MLEINRVFQGLKLDASCIKETVHRYSIFYDIQLGSRCSVQKFLNNTPEIEFRFKSNYPLYFNVINSEGLVRIQQLKTDLVPVNFFDIYSQFNKPAGCLPFCLGEDYLGNLVISDLAKHPHTLIAGSTGSGKSVALHNFVANSLLSSDVELYLSDPKNVEFSYYENLPSVKRVVYDYQSTTVMLHFLIDVMEQRFKLLKRIGKTNFEGVSIPKILIIIDEISDLMVQDKKNGPFQEALCRLAQKSRAAGIYLVIATQRPSVDVISGVIKANFPARIALKTSSKTDSRVVLDTGGAEVLIGRGDALMKSYQHELLRFRFPLIEPSSLVKQIKEKV